MESYRIIYHYIVILPIYTEYPHVKTPNWGCKKKDLLRPPQSPHSLAFWKRTPSTHKAFERRLLGHRISPSKRSQERSQERHEELEEGLGTRSSRLLGTKGDGGFGN